MMDISWYKGKKVLVTGHTGFKGAWLCQTLFLAGADVVGYALKAAENCALFDLIHLESHMKSIEGDIRDLEHLMKVLTEEKPEIVIHMAAQPLVRESYKEPVYTYETNVMGTVNVLECIRQTDCVKSFLNVTTDKVYHNKEWESRKRHSPDPPPPLSRRSQGNPTWTHYREEIQPLCALSSPPHRALSVTEYGLNFPAASLCRFPCSVSASHSHISGK